MNARKIRIRTKKSDSAYVYKVFEAHEGLSAYSTVDHLEGEQHRDMDLIFAPDAENDVRQLISELQQMMWMEIVSEK